MNKEMFISSSPHETKVAVCEDGQLVEIYFERDTDVGLVGGIYTGRVNRVLPGMQSAFVDIGLERDAFLYVSDFSLQDQDEFEGVLDESQARGAAIEVETPKPAPETGSTAGPEKPEPGSQIPTASEAAQPAEAQKRPAITVAAAQPPSTDSAPPRHAGPPAEPYGEGRDFHHRSHRGRRRRGRRGRGGFGDRRQERRPGPPAEAPGAERPIGTEDFEILPGESLAKHRHPSTEESALPTDSARTAIEESGSEFTTPRDTTDFNAPAYD